MRRTMIVTALAAVAGMAGTTTSASAQDFEFYVGPPTAYDRYGYDYGYPAYGYSYRPAYRWYGDRGTYYERPEHYRYGSKRWWRQMDRNGRGGHQK